LSERDEEVPELSPEAKAFLSRHAATGEPSADALARGRQRLASPAVPRVVRAMRYSRLPPEVMAAAAVVAVLAGAQLLYLAFRTPKIAASSPEVKTVDPDLEAIGEAWRAGDFTGASRLASQDCRSAACAPLASELAVMIGLARNPEALSDDAFEKLSAFDKKLSNGRDSALGRLLENRNRRLALVPPSPAALSEAEALFDEAMRERKEKNYERAVLRLEKCIEIAPGHHPCYRLLGSTYAALATRDQSAADMEKARKYYEKYVAVAPPEDEYTPKVRAILEAAALADSAAPRVDSPPRVATSDLVASLAAGSATDVAFEQDISRVALGDSAVAVVATSGPRMLHVKGIVPGRTTVMVWFANGDRRNVLIEVHAEKSDAATSTYAKATRSKLAGDWVHAIALARTVLKADPQHRGAQAIVDEGRLQAREVYLRGYQLRDGSPDEALKLFEQVIAMTPPDDETHQKAVVRVKELQRYLQ
jgi:tetratricopeptide (TPR) repeat protein